MQNKSYCWNPNLYLKNSRKKRAIVYAHTGLPKKDETKDDRKLLKYDDPNVILCILS